jgi:hypothetical protein
MNVNCPCDSLDGEAQSYRFRSRAKLLSRIFRLVIGRDTRCGNLEQSFVNREFHCGPSAGSIILL